MKTKGKKWIAIVLLSVLAVAVYAKGSGDSGGSSGGNSSGGSGLSGDDNKNGKCESGEACNGSGGDGGGSGSGGGGSGGGGTSAPSKPSQGAAAQSAKGSAGGFFSSIGNAISNAVSSIGSAISNAGNAISNAFSGNSSKTGGDPVLLSSGRYLFEETDFTIPGNKFTLGRVYRTEESITGSLGFGWSNPLDSRIIRGTSAADKAVLAKAASDLAALKELADIVWEDEDVFPIAEEIKAMYSNAAGQYSSLKAISDRRDLLHGLNGQALFSGTPAYYEQSGNESLVLVDEGGSPLFFEPAGNGVWLPQDAKERLTMRLVSADGGGADTSAGFVLYGKGGIKKYYNGSGLLTAIEEPNGNKVTLTRNSGGKATKITGPHGNEWNITYSGNFISKIAGPESQTVQYGYSGNQLVSVTDTENDTVRYTYENNRLKRIVKPDSSYIELTYGFDGAGGAKLVSATTHEEGKSEAFVYNQSQRVTTYTNHSGVWTKYWYDSKHRTTREEHSDGTVKTFNYNNIGLLSSETFNGSVTGYQYDARGNVTSKQYADGTREQWAWNALDLQTAYRDRDGVETQYVYDGAGNCTRVTRGGETLFTAAYGTGGRITQSKTGSRETEYYTYDAKGFIASRSVIINGRQITEYWTNDALGRVTEYTDGVGRKWAYTYNAKTTVEKTPTGLERIYTYNNRKDLISITEKDTTTGEVREQTVTYDRRHLATSVTDGAGNISEYSYREDGLMSQKKQGAWTWNYSYDAGGRLASVTRGMDGSSEQFTEQYGYRWLGAEQKLSVIEPDGAATVYQYDQWGRVTGVTNALGETSTRVLSGAGRVRTEQGASGGNFAYNYDSSGRLIGAGRENDTAVQVQYNADGTISEKTDRNGVRTQYFYDGRGQLIRETNPQGNKTYTYDGAGRVIHSETTPANTSGAAKYYTDWEYNGTARTVKVTDGGLYAETWLLNAWEEPVKKTDGVGNTRNWKYNGAGQLVAAVDGYGKETKYTWNAIGKVSSVIFADGTVTAYEYNHIGLVTKITDGEGVQWQGGYDGAGRLAWEKGRPGIDKQYKYDALGRITEVQTGGTVTERYSYSNRGRNVTFTDGAGASFAIEKNEYAEVVGETNRLGDRQAYSYDKEGRRISTTEYSGKQIRTIYSDAGGVTATEYADGTRTVITRDLGGNITSAAGATGVIRYRYDAGGRLVQQTDEGAGETTNYQYDAAGNRKRMTSGNRDVFYNYGKNNELLRVNDNTQRLTVDYAYNALGQEIKRTYGNGVVQETSYDKAGRAVLIVEWTPAGGAGRNILRAEGYVYDELGRRTHSVDENGSITKYQYDSQSRLSVVLYPWTDEKTLADKVEAEEAGLFFSQDKGSPERYTFAGDELSKVRQVLNQVSYGRGNLAGLNQLLWREQYTYDARGNRESKITPWGAIRYTYDAENRLISKGTITYTYDKDGNLLTETGTRKTAKYEYSGANRMILSETTDKIAQNRVTTEYEYDAYGRRTIKQDAGKDTMRTLYDGFTFEVIREGVTFRNGGGFTTNNATQRVTAAPPNHTAGERYRYITDDDPTYGERYRYLGESTPAVRYTGINVTLYGRGEAVAMNYTASSGYRGGAAYLGKDILGSVRSTSNEYGLLEDRYEYDAFGKPYKGELNEGMNLGYTGKPYDVATGMYNYGYRDYKPEQARFTTVDPIRDGNNWFSYVNNDPVNWYDPLGLSAVDPKQNNTPNFSSFLDKPIPTISVPNILAPTPFVIEPRTPITGGLPSFGPEPRKPDGIYPSYDPKIAPASTNLTVINGRNSSNSSVSVGGFFNEDSGKFGPSITFEITATVGPMTISTGGDVNIDISSSPWGVSVSTDTINIGIRIPL